MQAQRTHQENTGRVVRAMRKQLGYSQSSLCRKIGISQAMLSKVESGNRALGIDELLAFCKFAGISANAAQRGYIEMLDPENRVQTLRDDNPFDLPRRYAKDRGSKVRMVLAYTNAVSRTFGQSVLDEFLVSEKIDPDFFVNLDNQIHISFNLDLFTPFVSKGDFKQDFLGLVGRQMFERTASLMRCSYSEDPGVLEPTAAFIKNLQLFEVNHAYAIEGLKKNHIEFSIKPNWHLQIKSYRSHPILNDIPCRCRKSYLISHLAAHTGQRYSITELQCFHAGADRCIHRIEI